MTDRPTDAQAAPTTGAKSFQTYAEANAYSKGYYAGKKAATLAQTETVTLTTLSIAPVRRLLADRGIYLSDEMTKALIVVAHGITKGA
jgi:hypothetical protein